MESMMTDREKLEYITCIAFNEHIITASMAKDILGFRYIDAFYTWFDSFDIDAVSKRFASESITKYYSKKKKA